MNTSTLNFFFFWRESCCRIVPLRTVFISWEKYITQQQVETRRWKGGRETAESWVSRWVVRSVLTRVKSLRGVGDLRGERGRAVVRTKRLSRVPLRRKKKDTKREVDALEGENEESHGEKNERARTRLLQNGWMGLLVTWCKGWHWRSRIARHCGEIDYPISEKIWNIK